MTHSHTTVLAVVPHMILTMTYHSILSVHVNVPLGITSMGVELKPHDSPTVTSYFHRIPGSTLVDKTVCVDDPRGSRLKELFDYTLEIISC